MKLKILNSKQQIGFIIIITIICILAIGLVVYMQFFQNEQQQSEKQNEDMTQQYEILKSGFDALFVNEIDMGTTSLDSIKRKDTAKELIYTSYQKTVSETGKYDVNVAIPTINLDNDIANKYNKEINNVFLEKANSILSGSGSGSGSIYDVAYTAYINNDILSLAIRSTLKEGNNPQRVMLKTYNYDMKNNKEVSVDDILAYKNLTKEGMQAKIKESIKLEMEQAKTLNEIGYTVYNRDLRNDIYTITNSTIFLLGKDKVLYLIYPYGNTNYTSEMDVVVF